MFTFKYLLSFIAPPFQMFRTLDNDDHDYNEDDYYNDDDDDDADDVDTEYDADDDHTNDDDDECSLLNGLLPCTR